jgi:hypothetical protein
MKLCKDCMHCINDRCHRAEGDLVRSPVSGMKRRYFPDCYLERRTTNGAIALVFSLCGHSARFFKGKSNV